MNEIESSGTEKTLLQRIGNYVVLIIIGGAIGFIGTWYTTQERITDIERRLTMLEDRSASKEQTKQLLDTLVQQNGSIERRVENVERMMMIDRSRNN